MTHLAQESPLSGLIRRTLFSRPVSASAHMMRAGAERVVFGQTVAHPPPEKHKTSGIGIPEVSERE